MKARWLARAFLPVPFALAQGCAPSTASEPVTTAAPAPAAPDPLVFDTWVPGPCSPNGQPQGQCPPGDLFRVRLVPIADGLRSPRHIAFTPDGDLLITEFAEPAAAPGGGNQAVQGKGGHVRIVHAGALEAEPLSGWPTPAIDAGALWSVVVHPQFATNRLVYLYYVKKGADEKMTRALARARLDGRSLVDVQEIFVADAWIPGGPMAGRAVFGPDGMIYLTINDHFEHDGKNGGGEPLLAQQLDNDVGKVLRVRDDGGIPADNPFVARRDAKPEIFTYGQRNVTDFSWHPATGELWTTEIAPMGGDEINVLHAGHNYGWPLVSLGKNYNRKELNDDHWYRPGMDMPAMYWTPSISPSTLVWYTGDKLAPWKGHLFVGALNGQTLVRVAFDQPMPQAERRDSLFMSLGRRWRHVVQGPDGYLYALTEKRTLGGTPDPADATSGIVYRIEPAASAAAQPAQDPAAAREQPEIRQRQQDATPDTSGTGPYPAIKEIDAGLPEHVVYRPADLGALAGKKLGIYAFGNGACTDDGASARLHLLEIASHGYLAIAPGRIYNGPGKTERPQRPVVTDPAAAPALTHPEQLREAIDWAIAANERRDSPYFGHIDTHAVAVSGYSCGGIQALLNAKDPRVATVVIMNSGFLNEGLTRMGGMEATKAALAGLHTPTLYVLGGPTDIAYANGMDDFKRIDRVPVAVANIEKGHGGTYWEPNGGAAAAVVVQWLEWRLRGDAPARELFVGAQCGLCADPLWTYDSKGLDALH